MRKPLAVTATLTAALALALPVIASAAPTLYWGHEGTQSIGTAPTAGGSGGTLFPASDPSTYGIRGTTADPASGKLFWATFAGFPGAIYSGNLDGSGTRCLITNNNVNFPSGLTYNPANKTLYWANDATDEIRYVAVPETCTPVNSSKLYDASDFPNPPYTTNPIKDPVGVAVDPANNKIYWGNGYADGTVGYANLDGTGSGGLITLTAGGSPCLSQDYGFSVNVDPTENRLYLGNYSVATSNLDGTNCVLSPAGGVGDDAWGVARDADSLFIAVYGNDEIQSGLLSAFPGGVATFNTGAAPTTSPLSPVVVDIPTGAAAVSPSTAEVGAELTCSAAWSDGTPGMQWYRAPQSKSISWSKDGQPISGATSATFKPDSAGEYTCNATGTNYAGSKTLTSSATVTAPPAPTPPTPGPTPTPSNAFTVRTPLLVGTGIRTIVRVPGAGVIRQAGTFRKGGKVRQACGSGALAPPKAGVYRLRCRLTDAVRAQRRKGAIRVRLVTTYRPTGGTARAKVQTVVLRSLKPRFTG